MSDCHCQYLKNTSKHVKQALTLSNIDCCLGGWSNPTSQTLKLARLRQYKCVRRRDSKLAEVGRGQQEAVEDADKWSIELFGVR